MPSERFELRGRAIGSLILPEISDHLVPRLRGNGIDLTGGGRAGFGEAWRRLVSGDERRFTPHEPGALVFEN